MDGVGGGRGVSFLGGERERMENKREDGFNGGGNGR